MSRINFDTIRNRHPELSSVWHGLDHWFTNHQAVRTVVPAVVATSLPEVNTRSLSKALFVLIDEGILEPHYQLQTPQGKLVGPLFDNAEIELPDWVEGRFDEKVPTDDCRLVPVYRFTEQFLQRVER